MIPKALRYLIFSFFILHYSLSVEAQRYGNEWIHYGQSYAKIPVSETGIYRIPLAEIQKAGLTIDSPQKLQLFHRGQEVAITVTGSYLEFYGKKNDGGQDSLLYRPISARPHQYQTLYSETTYYFLTVGAASGKRISQHLFTNNSTLQPEKYHLEQQVQFYNGEYSFNNFPGPVPNLQQSFYEPGEGWTGGMIRKDSLAIWNVNLYNQFIDKTLPKPRIELLLNGRSDFYHRSVVKLGSRIVAELGWNGYQTQSVQTEINTNEIAATGQFSFSLQSYQKNEYEIYSLSLYKLIYPQTFDMLGKAVKTFYLPVNSSNYSILKIDNPPANARVYDVTDSYNFVALQSIKEGNKLVVEVPNTKQTRTILVTTEPIKSTTLSLMKFEKIDPALYNYHIITHASLLAGTQAFADYRTSAVGGGYKVKVFDIQQLYDQFSFGEHHPMSIRRFADYVLSGGQKPYLFLIGRPYTFPDFLKTTPDDLVPSIGYPGSDILLTAGLGGEAPDVPALPTGRLNVTQNTSILTYLKKVQEFESLNNGGLWRKNMLHLNGGKSISEIESLRSSLFALTPIVGNQWVGGRVSAISKSSPVEVENINISKQLNDGLSLVTFFGHASPTVTDLNIGFASTAGNGLNNQGKYPLMYFNGCAVGNIFFRYNTITSDWLLAPNKGAVVVMAHSYWSFLTSTNEHLQALYQTLYNNKNSLNWGIGRVHQELNRKLASQANDEYVLSNLHQSVLQGDPAVVIYPLSKPDYEVTKSGVFIQSKNQATSLNKADSLQVGFFLTNAGLYDAQQKLAIKVKLTYANQQPEKQIIANAVAYSDTLFVTFKNETGLQKIEVTADPVQIIDELSETNNTASLDIDWTKAAQTVSYPISTQPDKLPPVLDVLFDNQRITNGGIVSNQPEISISLVEENKISLTDTATVEVFLKKCSLCSFEKIANKNLKPKTNTQNTMQLLYTPTLTADTYEMLVTGRDLAQNAIVPYRIKFVVGGNTVTTFRTFPNPAQFYTKFEVVVQSEIKPIQFKVKVVDLLGRNVFEQTQVAKIGTNTIPWQPAENLNNGAYIYESDLIWADGKSEKQSGQVVVVR
jgi:Peptidase family C25